MLKGFYTIYLGTYLGQEDFVSFLQRVSTCRISGVSGYRILGSLAYLGRYSCIPLLCRSRLSSTNHSVSCLSSLPSLPVCSSKHCVQCKSRRTGHTCALLSQDWQLFFSVLIYFLAPPHTYCLNSESLQKHMDS